jgi:HEAT repeat protein
MRSGRSEVSRVFVIAAVVLLAGAAGCGAPEPKAESAEQERAARQQALAAQEEAQLRSADAVVRQQAAVSLLSMDYPPALSAVLDAMQAGEEPGVRISVIRAAGFCVDHRCFEALLGATADPVPEVRKEAAAALARFMRPEEVDAMTALVERGDTAPGQRQLIFTALGEGLAIRAVPVLLAGLRDGDANARLAALEALREVSNRQLPPDAAQWQRWWTENSRRTREDVLEDHLQALSRDLAVRTAQVNELTSQQEELMKLVNSAQPETPKLLLGALASRHALVREYSAGRLAALGQDAVRGLELDDKDRAALQAGLADDSVHVRRNVMHFAAQSEADWRDDLVRKGLADDDPVVTATAIEAVRANLGPEATARLEQLLATSRSREVREAAANALGKVGSEASVPVLVGALDDGEENVRWFAVEGLRKLHTAQAVPRVSELLEKDPSARVREIAASTLGELGQPAGVPALSGALADRNDRVREKAASALLALATGNAEVMLVVADSFQEQGLLLPAEQVLTRVIEQYGGVEEMKGRLKAAYEQLAAVQKGQKEFAAAARTYEKLDVLSGGSARVRREMLDCWIQGGDVSGAAGAVGKWLQGPSDEQKAQMLELALDAAERLAASGHAQEAGAVLDLATKAAGPQPEPKAGARIEALRRRVGG